MSDLGENEDSRLNSDGASYVERFQPVVDGIVIRNIWRFFVGGTLGLMVCVEFYRRYFGILPAPKPAAIIMSTIGVIIAISLPRGRIWILGEIFDDLLVLTDIRRREVEVPLASIRCVTGEAGLSFDGGEILLWKWVRISTLQGIFWLRMEHQSEWCFRALIARCPNAVGVSYSGDVCLPPNARPTSLAISQFVATAESEFRRQFRNAIVGAVSAGLLSLVLTGVLVFGWSSGPSKDQDSLAKGTVWIVVLWAVTALLVVHAARRWRSASSAMSKVREATLGPQAEL